MGPKEAQGRRPELKKVVPGEPRSPKWKPWSPKKTITVFSLNVELSRAFNNRPTWASMNDTAPKHLYKGGFKGATRWPGSNSITVNTIYQSLLNPASCFITSKEAEAFCFGLASNSCIAGKSMGVKLYTTWQNVKMILNPCNQPSPSTIGTQESWAGRSRGRPGSDSWLTMKSVFLLGWG